MALIKLSDVALLGRASSVADPVVSRVSHLFEGKTFEQMIEPSFYESYLDALGLDSGIELTLEHLDMRAVPAFVEAARAVAPHKSSAGVVTMVEFAYAAVGHSGLRSSAPYLPPSLLDALAERTRGLVAEVSRGEFAFDVPSLRIGSPKSRTCWHLPSSDYAYGEPLYEFNSPRPSEPDYKFGVEFPSSEIVSVSFRPMEDAEKSALVLSGLARLYRGAVYDNVVRRCVSSEVGFPLTRYRFSVDGLNVLLQTPSTDGVFAVSDAEGYVGSDRSGAAIFDHHLLDFVGWDFFARSVGFGGYPNLADELVSGDLHRRVVALASVFVGFCLPSGIESYECDKVEHRVSIALEDGNTVSWKLVGDTVTVRNSYGFGGAGERKFRLNGLPEPLFDALKQAQESLYADALNLPDDFERSLYKHVRQWFAEVTEDHWYVYISVVLCVDASGGVTASVSLDDSGQEIVEFGVGSVNEILDGTCRYHDVLLPLLKAVLSAEVEVGVDVLAGSSYEIDFGGIDNDGSVEVNVLRFSSGG